MPDQVIVIIPALDEADSLPRVLGDLPEVRHAIVVNNGSTDATAAVASAHGAVVVDELERGYGAACSRGLAAVRELIDADRPPPEVVVFFDADYSDHPELLPELVEPILSGRADFVLGSRLQGRRDAGAMPMQSVLGNRLACFLMRIFFSPRYTDLGPFRAIRYRSLCRLNMSDRGFGCTIEMQINAARAGLHRGGSRPLPPPDRPKQDQRHVLGLREGRCEDPLHDCQVPIRAARARQGGEANLAHHVFAIASFVTHRLHWAS